MKAVVKYYESGYASAEVPEIVDLREEITCSSIDDLIEYAKRPELPAAAEYAHIYVAKNQSSQLYAMAFATLFTTNGSEMNQKNEKQP